VTVLGSMKRVSLAAAAVAAILALAACSSSGSGGSNGSGAASTSQPPASSGPTITIKNFGYSGSLTVKAGTKVTVVNDDGVEHTLTDKAAHKFDTGSIAGNGGTGSFTAPAKPGSYPFGCTFHPEMHGTLKVTA
jgi:plastocyanin